MKKSRLKEVRAAQLLWQRARYFAGIITAPSSSFEPSEGLVKTFSKVPGLEALSRFLLPLQISCVLTPGGASWHVCSSVTCPWFPTSHQLQMWLLVPTPHVEHGQPAFATWVALCITSFYFMYISCQSVGVKEKRNLVGLSFVLFYVYYFMYSFILFYVYSLPECRCQGEKEPCLA